MPQSLHNRIFFFLRTLRSPCSLRQSHPTRPCWRPLRYAARHWVWSKEEPLRNGSIPANWCHNRAFFWFVLGNNAMQAWGKGEEENRLGGRSGEQSEKSINSLKASPRNAIKEKRGSSQLVNSWKLSWLCSQGNNKSSRQAGSISYYGTFATGLHDAAFILSCLSFHSLYDTIRPWNILCVYYRGAKAMKV